MDILDMAKELGTMIGNSKEMTRFKESEARMEGDDKAQTLMEEYRQLQVELVKVTKAQKDPAEVESVKEKLLLKQEELNTYPITGSYLEARSEFDRLMKNVNDVILFGMTGEEPCSPSKCGSCGGCK